MDDQLLDAAFRVFATEGFHGATTRRIAAEAGINEVTLFRRYHSKEELIVAAIRHHSARTIGALNAHRLPDVPRNVRAELGQYLEMILEAMIHAAPAHRTTMGEWGHRPAIDAELLETTTHVFDEVDRYLAAAQQAGLIRTNPSSTVITQVILGTLFADTLMRETMPHYYTDAPGASARAYCDIILDGVFQPVDT